MSDFKNNKVSFCIEPWVNLFVRNKGRIQPCCMNSTHLGDINYESLADVWNNKKIQRIRELVKKHQYKEAGCKEGCPYIYELEKKKEKTLITKEWEQVSLRNDKFRENIHSLKKSLEKDTFHISNSPITFDIQPIEACNMKCIMCNQDHNSKDKITTETISKLFKYKESIFSIRFQGGEIFVDKQFAQYLINLKDTFSIDTTICIITNASLLSFEELDKLTEGENPISFIISIDSINKDTYAYIRQTKHFDKVKRNIEYLSKIQKNKPTKDFLLLNFVVMKSNFYNLHSIIMWVNELDISINIVPIIGKEYLDENIFEYPNLITDEHEIYLLEAIKLRDKLDAKVYYLDTVLDKLQEAIASRKSTN